MRPFVSYDQSHQIDFSDDEIHSEIWADAVNFEGIYQISNLGRIRSIDREVRFKSRLGIECKRNIKGQNIKTNINEFGYEYVNLNKNGHSFFKLVHRLVLETFSPIEDSSCYQVNHINYNRRDNRVSNLEWSTQEENNNHSHQNCFGNDSSNISVTDLTTGLCYPSISSAAKCFNVNKYEKLRLCIDRKKLFKGHVFIYTEDIESTSLNCYIEQVIQNTIKSECGSVRPVVDISNGMEFDSLNKACNYIEGTSSGLIYAIRNRQPYKNHVFVYKDMIDSSFDIDSYKKKAFEGYNPSPEAQPIKDIVSGSVYKSMSSAAKELNIDPEKLRRSVNSKCICEGHIFVKVDDLKEINNEEEYIDNILRTKKQGRSIPLIDLTTNIEYSSINQVYTTLGIALTRSKIENGEAIKGHIFAYKYE